MFRTYRSSSILENYMIKDDIVVLLGLVLKQYKKGCEQSTYEEDRDLYGKWHGQIKIMIETIENGGIK